MGWRRSIRRIVIAAACGMPIACSEPTAPLLRPTLDDALFHVQLADPLSAVAAGELALPVVVPQIRRVGACAFSAERARFECATRVIGDLSVDRYYVLLDPAGEAQPEWNDRVSAVRLVTDVRSTDGSSDVVAHDEATLDRLRSGQQSLTGRTTMTWTRAGESQTATRATDLVILSRVIMPGIFPTGSITFRVSGVTNEAVVALTLDGTSIVSMLSSATGDAASIVCTYDLLRPDQPRRCE